MVAYLFLRLIFDIGKNGDQKYIEGPSNNHLPQHEARPLFCCDFLADSHDNKTGRNERDIIDCVDCVFRKSSMNQFVFIPCCEEMEALVQSHK